MFHTKKLTWKVFYFFCRRESVIIMFSHYWYNHDGKWHTNVTAEPLTLPGQYKYQPYLKPWWNTAYSEMSVKNQIKQAPDKIYLFYTNFRTPFQVRKFQ